MSTVQDPAGAGEANVVDIDSPVIAGKKALAVVVAGSPSAGTVNNLTTTGTIAADEATVELAAQGWSSVGIVIGGTWSGVLVFETSCDGGTTWSMALVASAPLTDAPLPAIVPTMRENGTYQAVAVGSMTNVRVRATDWTSGTANVRIVLGNSSSTPRFNMIQQSVAMSQFNNSEVNLAVGASFTGLAETTLGIVGIQVNVFADQPIEIEVQQSFDGTNWDIVDEFLIYPGTGEGRTFQATGSYFRVIATNVGNATTTTFRTQTALCPIVEALPRALTEYGKLSLATGQTAWQPSDRNFNVEKERPDLFTSVDGALNTWSSVLTDASSFRDDFPGSNLYSSLTGTVTFRNGSAIVTGSGTKFLTELRTSNKIKLSTDGDTYYVKVADVHSDELLELEEEYTGTGGSGTGYAVFWLNEVASGGSITVGSSIVNLISGASNGGAAHLHRLGDYLPYTIQAYLAISQRVANQYAEFGLSDAEDTPNNQAMILFDGTTNTTVKFRTSNTSATVQETTVTLPSGTTAGYHTYAIDVLPNRCVLFIDEVKVAEHRLHIPGPYDSMDLRAHIINTGAASSTTFSLDYVLLNNFNRVEISTMGKGDPLSVKEIRSGACANSNVTAAASDTALLAANSLRTGFTVFNDSTAILYLKFGTGASTTSFNVKMAPGGYYEDAFGYTGPVNGYWSAANGAARVGEMS